MKFAQTGPEPGPKRFVDNFFVKSRNSLLEEIQANPELSQELKTVNQEQQEDIHHKLLSVLEVMHSTQSDEEVRRRWKSCWSPGTATWICLKFDMSSETVQVCGLPWRFWCYCFVSLARPPQKAHVFE